MKNLHALNFLISFHLYNAYRAFALFLISVPRKTLKTETCFKLTLVCMYDVGLHAQCKVVSANEVPHHNSSANDFNRNKIIATNAKIKKIKTLGCTERRRCEREVSLRQHRFRNSRRLTQTGQLVRTCVKVENFRFHASIIQQSVRKCKI
ncbi:conserved hypothetical protein [Trichinella spiralis]|uniref:hypothetical protein n=1 Tax=Trichinella spiralis TaxID=6334 RepID=UPI0001EFD174|nr:conserved hypothetical protein [Trichinella spiralis]